MAEWVPKNASEDDLYAALHKLRHSYTFDLFDGRILVKQVMEHQVKYGLVGKVFDALVGKSNLTFGIKKFL